jgi:RNA-binding protein YhbY
MALSGQERRMLRSEAGRREARKELAVVRLPEDPARDPGYAAAAREIAERLRREEIVRVKTAAKKKKDAKVVGQDLAQAVGGEVAQVIGHTILLYKPANGRINDLKQGFRCILVSTKDADDD